MAMNTKSIALFGYADNLSLNPFERMSKDGRPSPSPLDRFG